MSKTEHDDWQQYEVGDYTIDLPSVMRMQELGNQPAGQSYCYAALPDEKGTFSILRGAKNAVTPEMLLNVLRSDDAEVELLDDEQTEQRGKKVRHLRFRRSETRPREVLEGENGERMHTPGGLRVSEGEYLFWSDKGSAWRAGYQLEGGDKESRNMLRKILSSLRIG